MLRHKNSRLIILAGGVSALALCAAPAFAQDATVSDVVVTGQRAAIQSAQAIKQDAEQIVDSITAVDIGALPDRSVSEALQRIPGITLQRTNENRDPARLASEGGAVFIRGLSWVRSELNGRDIFSANNGRGLSFEDVSADLLAGVDVYKNPSAEMVEGGVGGIVNLRTRKPFDQRGRLVAFSADYNYADLLEKGFVSANGLVSDRWETGMGEIGVLLSASVGNIGNRTDSVQTSRYERYTLGSTVDGLPAGTVVQIPTAVAVRRIDWEQTRTAFAGALQWRPNDMWEFTLQGLHAKADPKDIEHRFGDESNGFKTDNPTYEFDEDGFLQAGTINNASFVNGTRHTTNEKVTSDYSLNVMWTPNDRWSVSGDIQHVDSTATVVSLTVDTAFGIGQWSGVRPNLEFNTFGDNPSVVQVPQSTTPANAASDPGNYWWANAMDHIENNEANSTSGRLDAEYSFANDSFFKSFRFGVRATQKEAITRQTGYNWAILSQQFWGGIGNQPIVYANQTGFATFTQTGGWSGTYVVPGQNNPDLPNQVEYFTYDNFFRGDIAPPGVGFFPTEALTGQGTAHAFEQLHAASTGGPDGWIPLNVKAGCAPEDQFCEPMFANANPAGDNVSGGIAKQAEDTFAGYALLRFGMDDSPLGPMDGNIGIRVVRTENQALGNLIVGAVDGGGPTACAAAKAALAADAVTGNEIDCTLYNQAYAFNNGAGGRIPGVDQGNRYTNALPTLNLRFHLSDDLQLRFAAGRAMVRPSFAQMNPNNNVGFSFGANATGSATPDAGNPFRPNGTPFTATGGNPFLKPTISDQLDASLEYYFAPTGSLTFAAFYKDVKDYIFYGPTTPTYTLQSTLQFSGTKNTNGKQGLIKGFELAYNQFYDFLPGAFSGLGLQANFTYIDSSGGANTALNVLEAPQVAGVNYVLPLEGMSKTSYNVAALYEKYGISARLAYNWREMYLLTTSAANINRPVWSGDYGQLDGSILYSVTPKVKVGLQATNLLNERTFLYVSDDVDAMRYRPRYSWTDTDRRIAVLLRASF